jgi:hypothetical protein
MTMLAATMMASRVRRELAAFVAVVVAVEAAVGWACPFCGVVGESLAGRRDRSAAVAVGESAGPVTRSAAGDRGQPFTILQPLTSGSRSFGSVVAGDAVVARVREPVAGTAVLFATAAVDAAGTRRLDWEAIEADETLIGHVVAAPATSVRAAERLAWFARRLEHPEAAIAADAFTEFGLAPFAAVRAAAGGLDAARLRAWVHEPGIDPARRGFYGLALGLAAAATNDAEARRAAIETLRDSAAAPADDFRAGFDGILGGLLVAEGDAGLDWIVARGLLDATSGRARPLDQKHLLAALRFAWECLAETVPRPRIVAATRALLQTPVVAADAAIDLARYEAWDAVDDVAALWDGLGGDDPLVRRAVAGYLAACPTPAGRHHVEAIRVRDPERLAAALAAAALPPATAAAP